MKKDIVSMLPEELEQDFALLGEQKFRAKQVFQWISRGVRDFDKMTNLSKPLREKLKGEYAGRVTFMVKEVDGSEDTYKDLLGALETPALVMLDKDGNSTAILPSATDYNTLKAEIEKTLN